MENIKIVTAFYDIGRGEIPEFTENGTPYPTYLKRSNEKYISYFKMMCMLENEIVVFTSSDMVSALTDAAGGAKNVKVIEYDIFESNQDLIKKIAGIQQSQEFKSQIADNQILNIESWSSEYVLVTMMKPNFVNRAYDLGLIDKDENSAWLDFGFFRELHQVPETRRWSPTIEKNKISIFSCEPFYVKSTKQAIEISKQNLMYMAGTVLLGDKNSWTLLETLMREAQNILTSNHLVDDDQGLYLMALSMCKDLFMVYSINAPYGEAIHEIRNVTKYFTSEADNLRYPVLQS